MGEHTVSIDPADGCNSRNSVATHCTAQTVVLTGMSLTRRMLHRKVPRLWVGKIWREDLAGFIRRYWEKPENTHNRQYSASSLIFKWGISHGRVKPGIEPICWVYRVPQHKIIPLFVCVCVSTHIPVTALKLFCN